jgi:hypothetical protein
MPIAVKLLPDTLLPDTKWSRITEIIVRIGSIISDKILNRLPLVHQCNSKYPALSNSRLGILPESARTGKQR